MEKSVQVLDSGADVTGGVRLALRTVSLGAVLVVLGFGAAQAITLEEAVRIAVTTNPDVGVVSTDRRAVDQELKQARSLYLPSVDGRFAVGPEWTKRVAGNLPGREGRLTRQEMSLTLTQLLFDGFAVASEVQRQKARVQSAALRVGETSEFTGLDAVQAYLEVLRQQELVAIAENNVSTHQRFLEDMQRRLAAGVGSVADVRQAESRLARAQATLAEQRGSLEDAEATYIKVIGEAPTNLLRPASVDHLLPGTVELAVADALENNPTVQVAAADIATAEAELRASRADFFPKITLEASALQDRNINGVRGTSQSYQVLAVARWNLFRGFNTMHLNQEMAERLAEAREVLGQAQRRAEEETRLSWSGLESARERRKALEQQVAANEKVRDAYIEQFNLGQRTLLDVLDAENELFVSRGDLVTAEYVELFAGYRLLATSGRLLDALAIERPAEAVVARDRTGEVVEAAAVVEEEEMEPAAEDTGGWTVPAGETVVEEEGPAVVFDESVIGVEPAAGGEPAPGGAQPPTQGFKEAEGEIGEDTLLSLNFSPLWSVE